eukprot:269860-Pleurochrysis_carterae.AAC.4
MTSCGLSLLSRARDRSTRRQGRRSMATRACASLRALTSRCVAHRRCPMALAHPQRISPPHVKKANASQGRIQSLSPILSPQPLCRFRYYVRALAALWLEPRGGQCVSVGGAFRGGSDATACARLDAAQAEAPVGQE